MKTIVVAGISIKADKKESFTYEQLFKQAKESRKYLRVKNADKLIAKELKDNGFKPTKKHTIKAKSDK